MAYQHLILQLYLLYYLFILRVIHSQHLHSLFLSLSLSLNTETQISAVFELQNLGLRSFLKLWVPTLGCFVMQVAFFVKPGT